MTTLADDYPFARLPIATLLEWAHLPNPPFDEMRSAAPWLKRESEVRAYLEGALDSRLGLWKAGLFAGLDA